MTPDTTLAVASRHLTRDELALFWTIDRSEIHTHIYQVTHGRLQLIPSYFDVPG